MPNPDSSILYMARLRVPLARILLVRILLVRCLSHKVLASLRQAGTAGSSSFIGAVWDWCLFPSYMFLASPELTRLDVESGRGPLADMKEAKLH